MLHYTHTYIGSTRGCVGVAMSARAVILPDMIGRAVRRAGWLYGCPDICSRILISAYTHGGTVRPSACPAVPASILVLPRPRGAAVRPVRVVCCRPDTLSAQHLRGLDSACLPCAGCRPVENLTFSGDITFLLSENGFGGLERAKRRRGREIPCEIP